MVRGSYAEICAPMSGAETPCLQTRPRPQVSSDRRRLTVPVPPPPSLRLFLRSYSESALRRTPEPPLHRRSERRPSAAAAVPGQHLSFPSLRLHMDYLFGLPPGCVSPATFTLAMPTSVWRAQRPKIVCLNIRCWPEAIFKHAIDHFLVILAAVGSLIVIINHRACVSGGWLSRNVISTS